MDNFLGRLVHYLAVASLAPEPSRISSRRSTVQDMNWNHGRKRRVKRGKRSAVNGMFLRHG